MRGGRPCSQVDLCVLAAGASGDPANYGCGGTCGRDECRQVDIVAVVAGLAQKPHVTVDGRTEMALARRADALAADGGLELEPGDLVGLGPPCELPPDARRAARAVWGPSRLLDGPVGLAGDPDWAPDRCGLCPACRGLVAAADDYSVEVEPRAGDLSPDGIRLALAAHARAHHVRPARPRPIPSVGHSGPRGPRGPRELPAWLVL